uniref:TIR domain-containing protein n=1 Tax=Meloidogyne hapla TaxID=6305 RepID=A0A1I8BSU3_MELHA
MTNDTTIFSNHFPNINDDLFAMPITICIEQPKRIFGVFEYAEIVLAVTMLFLVLSILIIAVAKSCFEESLNVARPCFHSLNDVQKVQRLEERKCLTNNQSPVSSSESMTLTDRRKLISPRHVKMEGYKLKLFFSIPSTSQDERPRYLIDESCSSSSSENQGKDYDIFICYAKSEERMIEEFRR